MANVDMGLSSALFDVSRKKKTFSSRYLHRLQRRHFLLYDVAPGLMTLVALGLLGTLPFGAAEAALFATLWLATGLGVTVGYHRLFTHRSFSAAAPTRAFLAALGSMAGQGSPISWAALHRRHHEHSDEVGDPHSPNLHGSQFAQRARGLLHSHFTWMAHHEYPSVVHYVPDLLRDPVVSKVDRLYHLLALSGLLAPSLIGGLVHRSWQGALAGLLWGGFVRMFVLGNNIWMINSVLHTVGARLFATSDHSRNSATLSLLSLGESWHNNHHAFPASASFGLKWYRPDPGYWCIKALAALRLASDVHVPSHDVIARALARARPLEDEIAAR